MITMGMILVLTWAVAFLLYLHHHHTSHIVRP